MRVSAKADYAIRAMVELAAAGDGPVKADRIAQAQEIPIKFLENIMSTSGTAGSSAASAGSRAATGSARPADEITLAQVIRAVDGPLANVRGAPARGGLVRRDGRAAPRRLGRRAREPPPRARGGHARRRRRAASCRPRSGADRRRRRLAPALSLLDSPDGSFRRSRRRARSARGRGRPIREPLESAQVRRSPGMTSRGRSLGE